ncbi:MAG: hypothetical protein KAK00_07475 [Nanoarchaeota archaeon]|nr:hypothetical protein [Nanoarchaeota archaeon]
MIQVNLSSFNMTGAEFSVQEATNVLQPLLILAAGIFVYSFFVFKFYRFLAKKDIFGLNLSQYNEAKHSFFSKLFDIVAYIVEYILIFPLFVFFWFLVLVIFITVISTRPFLDILVASMALVTAIRISAYYNEDLSRDLAKMIPFALLGIFIIDVKLISFVQLFGIFGQFIAAWKTVIYYLFLTIVLEILLRMYAGIIGLFKK